jgi:hypothetical protein
MAAVTCAGYYFSLLQQRCLQALYVSAMSSSPG